MAEAISRAPQIAQRPGVHSACRNPRALPCIRILLGVLALLCSGTARGLAMTPAGTEIANWAVASYAGGLVVSAVPALITVTQCPGIEISPPTGQRVGDPGQEVSFAIAITNTGNADDVIDLALTATPASPHAIYADENGDGIRQSTETTSISDTGILPPNGSRSLFVSVSVPLDASGVATATLTATSRYDPGVSATGTYVAALVGTVFLRASFAATPLSGPPPLEVAFLDRSSSPDPIVAWEWDFGDGATSAERNPTHTYDAFGSYTVQLTIRTANGAATERHYDYISVLGFTDVPADHWAYDSIMACFGSGIVAGYPDGTFLPGVKVTRSQMAVFIARAMAQREGSIPPGPSEPSFPDVPPDYWAYDSVEYAAANHVVEGYEDGNYHPNWTVTRAQMAGFVARAIVVPPGEEGLSSYQPPPAPSFLDVPAGYWAYRHIEFLASEGVVSGYPDHYYRPTLTVTRDQMTVFIARAFHLPAY
jgi:PKD repeat protein